MDEIETQPLWAFSCRIPATTLGSNLDEILGILREFGEALLSRDGFVIEARFEAATLPELRDALDETDGRLQPFGILLPITRHRIEAKPQEEPSDE